MKIFVAVMVFGFSTQSFAWGGRGHHSICSTAVHLVQNEELKKFLKLRPHIMGHVCNIPDIYWRSLPDAKSGDAAHYIHLEMTGYPNEVTENFADLSAKLQGKPNLYAPEKTVFSPADEIGTLWWRADQFYRRVNAQKEAFATAVPPKNSKEEQDENLPYNKDVYFMMVNMALMGHFVGDASQPLHAVSDYDGWKAGHGGLHSYYEDAVVGEAPADLEGQIYTAAKKLKLPWLKDKSVIARMKHMSILAAEDVPELLAKDPMFKKSEVKKDSGMEVRTKAERKGADFGWKMYGPQIVTEMARSSLLLARLWDEEYEAIGKPPLAPYRSYKYPFTPDFVPLDYVPAGTTATEKK